MRYKKALIISCVSAVMPITFVACADNDNSNDKGNSKDAKIQINTSNSNQSISPPSAQPGYISISDMMDMMSTRQARMMDQMMNDMFYVQTPVAKINSSYSSYPQSSFITKKDKYVLELAAPGIDKKNLSIQIENRTMTIAYKKSIEKDNKDSEGAENYQSYTSQFQQVVTIPSDANVDKRTSSYKDGIITVALPRMETEKSKARTIAIE
ncbi:MAG TPA: hypothetical protein DD381_09595 [Lentisphaeria bacterium]|nr:MAG: hypothetical protein A2X47_07470 [Lentisphaerae bacterium GWF2_38_69]HBM16577.1 hypothetical protein [Lentisphaeria bacterium]